MPSLRPILALIVISAIAVACSAPSTASDDSGGATPSATASVDGGGGGGGGTNGSVTYQITGDYEASGELPFLAGGVSTWLDSAGGWVANFGNTSGEGAVIALNTQAAAGTSGQVFTFGDGTVILAAGSTPESGFDCTFTLTKNDASGLKGDLKCTNALAMDSNTGAQKHVQVTAHWDAHP